ncbi:hypothetical protein [Leptolyngbya ohadii]|nr:hypothetical protein [Leptolyngbya ohadii]
MQQSHPLILNCRLRLSHRRRSLQWGDALWFMGWGMIGGLLA